MAKADYNVENRSIKNPLNMWPEDGHTCPICGRDTWGHRIADNSYVLNLSIWSGNPCTQVPERKDLKMFICHDCREKIYKSIANTVEELKEKKKDRDDA